MNEKPVVDARNLPRKAPTLLTLILVVGLKTFNAPEVIWGAVGAALLFIWFQFIRDVILYKEKEINIFQNKNNKI